MYVGNSIVQYNIGSLIGTWLITCSYICSESEHELKNQMYETCWTVVTDENPHQQNTADLLCGTKYVVEERVLLAIGKS